MKTRIVFIGSPDFSVPSLKALVDNYDVVGIVTQPDRPAGRGRILTPPSIKKVANDLGIPTLQPVKLRTDHDAKHQLREWNPEVIVVAAFGQILQKDVLEIAPFGCINVHASLLPRWRGVSPIQAAILNGDDETGVTIMKMDEGIDTGDIISQRRIKIGMEETGGSLFTKLSILGADLLIDSLPGYINLEIIPHPQTDSPTPYAPMLRRSDGELDFNSSSTVLSRQVRAYYPWPGSFTIWEGKHLKVHKAYPVSSPGPGIGIRTTHKAYPAIGTSDGLLVLQYLQAAGKNAMTGQQFLRGAKNWENINI